MTDVLAGKSDGLGVARGVGLGLVGTSAEALLSVLGGLKNYS